MNSIIEAAFSRNRTVLLLLAFLLLAGILSYRAIPKESNPERVQRARATHPYCSNSMPGLTATQP